MQTDRLFVFPCISEMEMLPLILISQQDTSLQRTVREISSVAGKEHPVSPHHTAPFIFLLGFILRIDFVLGFESSETAE